MSATAAIIGYGTTLGYSTVGANTYTTLAEVLDFKPPATKVGKAEATHYTSDNEYEEHIPGFKSVSDAEFEVNYKTATTAALEPLIGITKDWKCTLPDTHTVTFSGWISDDGIQLPNKKTATQKVKITVTGPVTYA